MNHDPRNPSLRSQKLKFQHFSLSFPGEHVLQITLDRPDKLNCIDQATSKEIQQVWELFDDDNTLWVGIITGRGRAFCTGADLHEWNQMNRTGLVNKMDAPGLAGLPRRMGKKPIIAAVNGLCMGGGFEMVANCDLVIACASALFSLPEVKRGIVPVAGCLPRLTRILGLQRTSDLVLTGRTVSAKTLQEWGLVTQIVGAAADVASAACEIAQEICKNSPDALIVARRGIRLGWESGSVEEAVSTLAEEWYPRLMDQSNFAEGIQAFVEKRAPNWLNSKL